VDAIVFNFFAGVMLAESFRRRALPDEQTFKEGCVDAKFSLIFLQVRCWRKIFCRRAVPDASCQDSRDQQTFKGCVDANFFIFCRCDACGKSFVDERALMRHAKIHATNKPFPCLHCDKGYVDANSLRKHMRNHECEVSGVPQLPTSSKNVY
jgi:hypothetical protein